MTVSADTRLLAVIGQPVRHSLSPLMHNAWLEDHAIDAVYLALEASLQTFKPLVSSLAAAGAVGVNVTVPFKELALQLADHATPAAARAGAANTLVFGSDGIEADNTDGAGLLADLDARAPGWRNSGGHVVVLGGGGAARGIVTALAAHGFDEIRIVTRRHEQAAGLIMDAGAGAWVDWANLDGALEAAGLVINATPLGLGGASPLTPDFSATLETAVVYDTVYAPRETAFLAAARGANRRALDGLGMLVGQGALAFNRWFGLTPDVALGLSRLEAALAAKAVQ
jgi:shikimate dehydrogenase